MKLIWSKDENLDLPENNQPLYVKLVDFKAYFNEIKIFKYIEDYQYNAKQIIQNPGEYVLIKMTIFKPQRNDLSNNCFISLIQEESDFYNKSKHKYNIGRLILCKLSGEEILYIKGEMGQGRETILEESSHEYREREYLLFCELDKIKKPTKYVIQTYSRGEVSLKIIPNSKYPNILEKIYEDCAKAEMKIVDYSKNCHKYANDTKEGYSYIFYDNQEEGATLVEDMQFTNFQKFKLL